MKYKKEMDALTRLGVNVNTLSTIIDDVLSFEMQNHIKP